MAYDEKLVGRVRKVLARRKALTEKKMFGGLTFLMQGNMCCGVTKNDDLVLRLGPERSELSSSNTCDHVTSPVAP